MTKLNPCPDCGREPDLEGHGKAFRVACWHCSSAEFITARTANGAVSAWNAATNGEQAVPTEKTLRDDFAMAALNGLLAGGHDYDFDWTAERAYMVADSMLKERNK